MIYLPGYKINKEFPWSKDSIIYSAIRETDGRNVMIKSLNQDNTASEKLAAFINGYQLLNIFAGKSEAYGIFRVLGLEKYERTYAIIMEYFEGISPEVWEFYIGGYQVLGKWLKDRQGRQLSYDDLTHYQQVVVALQKTIELMEKIDNVIPEWPIG